MTSIGLLDLDAAFGSRAIRDTVRRYVDTRIRPAIGEWLERGQIPGRELARGEPGDSGIRSPVS